MRLPQALQKNTIIALALIVLVFIILAVPFNDGRSTYAYGELARDLNVLRQLDQGEFIQLGPISSLGNYHFGSAYYYISYPFVKIMDFQPYSLAVTSSIFLLLSIVGLFLLVNKWFRSEQLALLASEGMAISILTFQLTKYGSNPNFIPFFTIIFFYVLRELVSQPKNVRLMAVLAVSAGVLTQLHAVTFVVIPLILLAAYFTTELKKTSVCSASLFFLIVALIYFPYLYYEATHNFDNIHNLFTIGNNSGSAEVFYVSHLLQFYGSFLNPIFSTHGFFDVTKILTDKVQYFFAGILLVIPIVVRVNLQHKRYWIVKPLEIDSDTKKLLIYWLGIPALIYILPIGGTNEFHYYYFFVLMPLLFIAMAYGLHLLFKNGFHLLGVYLVIAYMLLQGMQMYLYITEVRAIHL